MTEKIYTPSCKEEARHLLNKKIMYFDYEKSSWEIGTLLTLSRVRDLQPFQMSSGKWYSEIKAYVPKLKPVNEACLFKPVLMRKPHLSHPFISDKLQKRFEEFSEYIYVGKCGTTGIYYGSEFNGDIIVNTSDFTEAKRIDGYDYGDGDGDE